MTLPNSWSALNWWIPAVIILIIALPVVFYANWSRRVSLPAKLFLISTKVIALVLLVLCLLEPTQSFTRPVPGSNALVLMADASQSLQVNDWDGKKSRAEALNVLLNEKNDWLEKLDEQFELRRYQFDSRLNAVTDFQNYQADGQATAIADSLEMVSRRIGGKPTAGIVLLTDGSFSESSIVREGCDFDSLPPVYPVIVASERPIRDLSITAAETSQTNFESAPVTIKADLMAQGLAGQTVKVELLGIEGKPIDVQEVRQIENGKPFAVRFQLKPTDRGINVFHVRALVDGATSDNESTALAEATSVNNQRTVVVDRGQGPFRILYLAGRPNWEYKFMRRAIAEDNEINLVGLLRVARKEPKFTFRNHAGVSTNPLFRGFGNQGDATAEQYDEPVMIRLDTRDEVELRNGFPKDSATLFEYDAIVLDDIEAAFFTQDQKTLISQFVTLRGGGLLMLGGMETFAQGGYDRTPIGEALPVYLDGKQPASPDLTYQLDLTRDGWIQPWIRLESTREKEEKRLEEMPGFHTLSISQSIKPGASVLANVKTPDGKSYPALVVQRFGKGWTAALMIGDLWRWKMNTPEKNEDLDKSWRQTMRWLVSDVPRRVQVAVETAKDPTGSNPTLSVQVFDEEYKPQLNADVNLTITTPTGQEIKLTTEQDTQSAGRYKTTFVSREAGAYRVTAEVKTPEGNLIEKREAGWVSEPAAGEFRSLEPNRNALLDLATRTGGQVIEMDELDSFAASFENRKVPIEETQTRPWWHRWSIFLAAISLLILDWGFRRVAGLA
jgi:hypothetical protein